MRNAVIWGCLAAILVAPLMVAATSPLLQWRDPIYIAAGLAGAIALCILLVQPLLASAVLPGITLRRSRAWHRWVGCGLLVAVALHVAGLWLTSPPDMIDAMLFRSPTPFSAYGVIAMWALVLAASFAALRARIGPRLFRPLHTCLIVVAVLGSVAHAIMIEGTMGAVSKALLCGLVILATAAAVWRLRAWRMLKPRP